MIGHWARCLGLVGPLGIFLAGSQAHAERQVVMLDFEGGRAARPFRQAVQDVFEERNVQVIRTLVVNVETDTGVAELTAEFGADAVVSGALTRSRRGYFLDIALAAEGVKKSVNSVAIGRQPRLNAAAKVRIRRAVAGLLKVLDTLPERPPKPTEVPTSDEPEPEPKPKLPVSLPERAPTPIIEARPAAAPAVTPTLSFDRLQATNGSIKKAVAAPEPPKKKPWRNFAAMRPALSGNRLGLRTYWDSRDYAAIEGALRAKLPFDFVVFGRTTLRKYFNEPMVPEPDQSNLDSFGLDALFTPAFFSVGAVAHVGSPLGFGPEAIRFGGTHTFMIKFSENANIFFLTIILPYDSTQPAWLGIESINITLGPVKGELIAARGWPSTRRIDETTLWYLRPDLRVKLWKSLGVYSQYEYNSVATTEHKKGLRFGVEVSTNF